MRSVGTLTELLRVRKLNPKFNRGPKSQPKGLWATFLKDFELNLPSPYQHE